MKFGKLIIDGETCATYSDLLEFVNSAVSYRPAMPADSPISFIFNLVTAIANSCSVAVSDALSSPSQFGPALPNSAAASRRINNPARFKNTDELLRALKLSKSKIALFTSGSSGKAKRVEHSMGTLLRGLKESEAHSNDVWGLAYEPSHMAGVQVLFQVLFNGNAAVNLFGKNRKFILGAIDAHKISHISATPTFYRLLLPADKPHPSVTMATLGGEASIPALYLQMRKLFPNAKITNIYASTEFGTLLVSDGSAFRIPQNLKKLIRIKNGELQVHRSLCGSALQCRFDEEFAITGDMVEFTGSGKEEFHFVGRSCNIINIGGFNVNPEEVEEAIALEPFVRAALVYGRKNSVLGNVLCADVVLDSPLQNAEEKLRKSLAQRLQQYKIPRKFNIVEKLPTSSTCKIKRQRTYC